jgi:hypothetical protein
MLLYSEKVILMEIRFCEPKFDPEQDQLCGKKPESLWQAIDCFLNRYKAQVACNVEILKDKMTTRSRHVAFKWQTFILDTQNPRSISIQRIGNQLGLDRRCKHSHPQF